MRITRGYVPRRCRLRTSLRIVQLQTQPRRPQSLVERLVLALDTYLRLPLPASGHKAAAERWNGRMIRGKVAEVSKVHLPFQTLRTVGGSGQRRELLVAPVLDEQNRENLAWSRRQLRMSWT